MILKRILMLINQFFGILLLLSFPGVFISIFFFRRFTIYGHNFGTTALLATLIFFSFLVLFILTPILKSKSGFKIIYQTGWRYRAIVLAISVFVLLFGYFSLYIPLNSQFFGEIDITSQKTVSIETEDDVRIYFEFDVGRYVLNGTRVEVIVIGPDNWQDSKTYIIAKKKDNDNTVGGTVMTSAMEKLPTAGEYNISFEQLDDKTQIKRVRIFTK